jgi:hypothetical protein
MLDYCMDAYSSGTATEWVSYEWESEPGLPKYRIQKLGSAALVVDIGVVPGERATAEVLANDRERQLLASVIRKLERHAEVSSASHEAAKTFLDALPRTTPLPKVAPDGDGGLLLAWTLESGTRTLVTIDGWTIHCVSRAGTEMAEYSDDLAFDGTIPVEVQEAIGE